MKKSITKLILGLSLIALLLPGTIQAATEKSVQAKAAEIRAKLPAAAKKAGGIQVIVKYKNTIDESSITKSKAKVQRSYKNIPVKTLVIPDNALEGLLNNPHIESIEPEQEIRVTAQTVDWGITKIEAQKSWPSWTGTGVKVAIVDTGIAPHPDLRIAGGASFTSYTTSYNDDNGHGTHVAGIVGALNNDIGIVGVAPAASLYGVKVLNSYGRGYLSDIIGGIDWSITNKMDIINLSLGTPSDSPALKGVVDKAYNSGILVVAAAGNSGAGSADTMNYPARYPSVISVGATDSSNSRAYFSSVGPALEVAAPGYSILSTSKDGGSYVKMSGTSMASPFVAGELALIKQANPTLSAAECRSLLSKNVLDLGAAGRDSYFGYGLIKSLDGSLPAPPSDKTAPVLGEISADIADILANLYFRSNEAGKFYYLVRFDGMVVPTAAAVKSQAQVTAVLKGQGELLASTNTVNLNGLFPSTLYKVYIVTEDAAGNLSGIYSRVFRTTPSANQNTLTAKVATNKTTYVAGSIIDNVGIYTTVLDQVGRPVTGATVKIVITPPVTSVPKSVSSFVTDSLGKMACAYATTFGVKGIYRVDITAYYQDYLPRTASTTFITL